jgi:hypothetical protein
LLRSGWLLGRSRRLQKPPSSLVDLLLVLDVLKKDLYINEEEQVISILFTADLVSWVR